MKRTINRLANWLQTWSARSQADWAHEFSQVKLQILQQSIKDALRFLRTTHIKRPLSGLKRHRRKLPWYLVLGAEKAGKTSLLAMSGLSLVSTDNQPVQQVSPTAHCHWFFGNDAVFIDVSGALLVSDAPEDYSLYLWKKFVGLLHRHRRAQPVDGLVVCIDLLDFQYKDFDQRRLHIEILRHHIQTFKHNLPVHVIFTRCDRMQGFTEFFQTLSSEEREQACGIALPRIDQQNFSQQVEIQLNAFLQRINQQIILRLQRERNPEKRSLIKNFPLQLEAQKSTIAQLVSQLHTTSHCIQSIYFTSSQQEGIQNDALAPLSATFGLPNLPSVLDRPLQKNSYFVRNALKRIIGVKHPERKSPLPSFFNRGILAQMPGTRFYAILAGVVLVAASLLLPSYFANKHAIAEVQTLINHYQASVAAGDQGDQQNAFALTNTLRTALDEISHVSNPLTQLVFHRTRDLTAQLNILYQQALVTQFVPALQQALETQLQNANNTNSPALFNTLKAYLMLSDSPHVNRAFINTWFAQLAKQSIGNSSHNAAQEQRLFILNVNALLDRSVPFKTDPNVVNQARDMLNSLQPTELAYALLQEKYIISPHESPLYDHTPPLYTAAYFSSVFHKDIPAIVIQITQQDAWVLDNGNAPPEIENSISKQLLADTQQLYKERYLAFWQAQLADITVPTFATVQAARAFANTLGTNRSALLQPLNTIQINLKPLTSDPGSERIVAELDQTRELLTKTQMNSNTAKALDKFKMYLNTMLSSSNNDQAVLMAAQDRMRTNGRDAISQLLNAAKTAPAPSNRWLNALAINTWAVMLQTSQQQINALWASSVVPKYNSMILNRYPIFKDAKTDIALADFAHFFGPDGIVDGFFKRNLAAFVDTNSLYWQWKSVDGLHLNIAQTTLEMLNRAYVIRRMYFADNQKIPQFKFTLMPTNTDLISENVTLAINTQRLNYATDFRQARNFIWPTKPSVASLEIPPTALSQSGEDQGGDGVVWKETGDWALFKLLAHAEMATSANPRLYQFEFKVNGKQMVYELLTANAFNPLIPDIAAQFRCPEQL